MMGARDRLEGRCNQRQEHRIESFQFQSTNRFLEYEEKEFDLLLEARPGIATWVQDISMIWLFKKALKNEDYTV
jgi:hypothetical protein